jgi:hypothetical protein
LKARLGFGYSCLAKQASKQASKQSFEQKRTRRTLPSFLDMCGNWGFEKKKNPFLFFYFVKPFFYYFFFYKLKTRKSKKIKKMKSCEFKKNE